MLIRKLGSILRGRATPLQIFLGGLLGGAIGFQPGWYQAPGILASLLILLLICKATLSLALLAAALGRLVALALQAQLFGVGRALVDGPAQPLFERLINAPLFAWFGFECYVATGGLVLGALFGAILGLLCAFSVSSLRRRLAGLEEGSERYQEVIARPWVKFLLFVFVGGSRGKKSWSELAQKRFGNPIRIWGVVLVLALIGLAWFAQNFLGGPLVARHLRTGLEGMNGATVDLGAADVDLARGSLRVAGLAMADPDRVERDLFRSELMEADAGIEDLLRKRIVVDRLALRDARSGALREQPGERIDPPAPAPEEPPQTEGNKSLEDYLADARLWRERLRKAREWMKKLSKGDPEQEEAEDDESLRERLEREAHAKGWAAVRADHLIQDTPAFLVREIEVGGLVIESMADEVFDVQAANLSTAPALVPDAPRLQMNSRSGDAELRFDLAADAGSEAFALDWRSLPADWVNSQLEGLDPPLLAGGTIDLSLRGGWSAGEVGRIDAPLAVTLRDTTLSLSDLGSAPVKELVVPIHLSGPLDQLSIRIDTDELADALRAAGADELERRVRSEIDEKRTELEEKARDEVEGVLEEELGEEAKGLLDGLLGGKKDDD